MKLFIRIVISIIIGLPSLPFLYMAFGLMGLILIIPFASIFMVPCGYLINDKELLEDGIEGFKLFGMFLILPFMFWKLFIDGKNPFTELGI